MKKLDVNKLSQVDSDAVIGRYKAEYADIIERDIRLSAQNDKLMGIIQYAFAMDPDTFPKDFIIEEEENGTDNK